MVMHASNGDIQESISVNLCCHDRFGLRHAFAL